MDAKKAARATLSHCLWILSMQKKLAPRGLMAAGALLPVNMLIRFWQVYLPAYVVGISGGGQSMKDIFPVFTLLSAAILLAAVLKNTLEIWQGKEKTEFQIRGEALVRKKSLGLFYQLYEKKETRDLQSRALRATQMWDGMQPISDMAVHAFALAENVLCYLLFGGLIAGVNPYLVPVIMLGPVLNLWAMRRFNRWQHERKAQYADLWQKLDYIKQKSAEFAAGKDIRLYSMADWFQQIFTRLLGQIDALESRKAARRFMVSLLSLSMILLRDALSYAVLISLTLSGRLSVDQFVLCFGAVSSFAAFFGNILDTFGKLHQVGLMIEDFRNYLALPELDPGAHEDIAPHLKSAPEITFSHVTFRYPEAEKDAIHDLSFQIKKGESIALVGLNGAGKTTLVKLLCGLYRPDAGNVCVNGISSQQFAPRDYYKLFSPVFQDSACAFFSLAETVSGMPGGGFDEVRAENCLRLAGLGEKIDVLPHGMHTKMDKQLNEDAIELSGGEKQKLMLARALYKDAPMLVLDEPTAALDPIAENRIYRQYAQMTQGKTAIFISHRLASTRFCARIFYLKEGVITEEGTHDQLMALGGEYSRLYETQSCWYREEEVEGI